MIERMFERIPAWAIGAAAMVVIVVLIYTAGWWWAGWPAPRWQCDDGYWHWRGCDGHDEWQDGPAGISAHYTGHRDHLRGQDADSALLALPDVPAVAAAGDALELFPETAADVRALDEAWPEQLHRINQDIRGPSTYSPPFTIWKPAQTASVIIDWAGMSWRDRGELERWDWGRRMAADGAEWVHRMDVERHAWRSEMGLAA